MPQLLIIENKERLLKKSYENNSIIVLRKRRDLRQKRFKRSSDVSTIKTHIIIKIKIGKERKILSLRVQSYHGA